MLEVIEALPHPVMIVGRTERVEALNGHAKRLFGPAVAGRHYITAIRQPAVLDAIEAVLAGAPAATVPYLGIEGSRDTTWAVHVAPVDGAPAGGEDAARVRTGRPDRVVLSFEDRTSLEEAGRMRRDFVANVSHELRTPLTALLGFVETLKGPARNDPAAYDRFLDLMETEASRMARLVGDLLSLSRVEENERIRPRDRVAMVALVQTVLERMDRIVDSHGIEIVTDLPQVEVEVAGDANQLGQVLANLIENAIKYGGPGGRVTIALSEPGDQPGLRTTGVRLSVSDEGDGIAPHHIPRLTERFYRVDTHRSREVGGTGLGLAIVKHIVGRHRGRLRVLSALGEGSSFVVLLPVD